MTAGCGVAHGEQAYQSMAYVDRSVVDDRAEHGEVDHGAELLKSVLETRSSRS
jgi:hypothetical protein